MTLTVKSYQARAHKLPLGQLPLLRPPPPLLLLPLLLLLLERGPMQGEAHGALVEPVARNSLWRVDKSAPVNYNDIELFCGGMGALARSGGRCGLCGDAYSAPEPREHETGGRMATNRTVRNYFPGATLDVIVDLDTNHAGYFEFELCRRASFEEAEREDCFERLRFVDGAERRPLSVPTERGLISMSLLIPAGLEQCPACVLRWNYRAGNNWGQCADGSSATGCGLQELYRNCADISIGYGGRLASESAR